jgi:hypothetical protein
VFGADVGIRFAESFWCCLEFVPPRGTERCPDPSPELLLRFRKVVWLDMPVDVMTPIGPHTCPHTHVCMQHHRCTQHHNTHMHTHTYTHSNPCCMQCTWVSFLQHLSAPPIQLDIVLAMLSSRGDHGAGTSGMGSGRRLWLLASRTGL